MSDRALQSHPKGNEMSGKYLPAEQSAWMGHWMQPKHRRDNLGLEIKDSHETKQQSEPSGLKGGLKEGADSGLVEAGSKGMNDGSHLKNDRSDLLSFPTLDIHRNRSSNKNQVPGTQTGHCNEFKAATTGKTKPQSAYAFGHQLGETRNATSVSKFLPEETTPNLELELRARDSVEGGCMPDIISSRGKLLGVSSSYPYGIMYRKENIIPFASTSKEHLTHRYPYHDFNIDTVRMTSTLDAREYIHLGPPMFAERTRHFLITEKMAIGMSDEGKIFRESTLSAKFNGNLGRFLSLSSASGHVRPGLKLRLLDGSTDSEQIGRGSEDHQKDEGSRSIGRLNAVGALTDETTAETCNMEVDPSLENNGTSGLAVSRSNKAALQGQSSVSAQGKSAKAWLPDMNEVAQTPDGSENDEDPRPSRTQSLDMECLFSNKDCPSNSKPVPSHVVQPRAELGSRWVKRLKQSSSYEKYAAVGTKSSTIEEASSYEKLRKLSRNLFNRSIGPTNSVPPIDIPLRNTSEHNKKIAEDPHQSNRGKSSSSISLKKDRNALLSNSWIRRWRHDQTASSKKKGIPSEPSETPRASYDHLEKKTFPSIAAMALMGKAMHGFRPCKFTKKGTFIVWNTNDIPHD